MAEKSSKALTLQETANSLNRLLQAKAAALPKDFNQTRFLQNCMTVLQDTKDIEKCQPLSIARTMLKGAFLGLDFFNKECYAIPYGNNLQFQTDYKGETKMAKKYSIRRIKDIYAKVVRDGDMFEEKIVEGHQSVNFTPKPFNNGPIVGAFAVVIYDDGGMDYETMPADQIEAIRTNFSKMPNSIMWKNTPEEAYKKTVLRRLCKHIEKDFDSIEQAKEYDDSSDSEFKKDKTKEVSPFDVEYEVSEDEPVETPIQENKAETKSDSKSGKQTEQQQDIFSGTPLEDKKK